MKINLAVLGALAGLVVVVAACETTKIRAYNTSPYPNGVILSNVQRAAVGQTIDLTGVAVGKVTIGDLKAGQASVYQKGKDAEGPQLLTVTGATVFSNGVQKQTVTKPILAVGVTIYPEKRNVITISPAASTTTNLSYSASSFVPGPESPLR